MAKELPYYKFEVLPFLTGDICLERWELQGIFTNICAYYWSKDCQLSFTVLLKKYKGYEPLIQELIDLDIFKTDGEYLSIHFLNEQWASKETQKMVNAINGKKGGRPRKEIDMTRFYIIKCFNNNEEFIKIGITTSSIASRYSSSTGNNATMPYSYDILIDEVLETNFALNIERSIKSNFKSYDPKIQFKGCVYECFDINNLNIVNLSKEAIRLKSTECLNPNGLNKKTDSVNFALDLETNIEKSIVKESKEEESKEEIAFDSDFENKKEELINLLVDVWGFSEQKYSQQKSMVFAFVTTQLKSIDDINHFAVQYSNYDQYKKISGEQRHNSTGYFGTQAMQFQNSAWNSENWGLKLEQYKANTKSQTKFEKLKDAFNAPNPYRKNGE